MAVTSDNVEDEENGPGSKAPAKRKRGPAAKYDWENAEHLFINGITKEGGDVIYLNTRELAEHLNIPTPSLQVKATARRWRDRRAIAQLELAKKKQAIRQQELVGQSIELDKNSLTVAKLGLSLVQIRLGEIAQEVPGSQKRQQLAKERLAAGLPVEKSDLYSAVRAKELVELATAGQVFQQIGMRSLGTDVNRVEVSGPDGGAIEHAVHSVTKEMTRDDPERVAALLKAFQDSRLLELSAPMDDDDDNIQDAEIVE